MADLTPVGQLSSQSGLAMMRNSITSSIAHLELAKRHCIGLVLPIKLGLKIPKSRMKTCSGREEEAPPQESLQKFIAYQISQGDSAPIRPAPRERRWMEDAEEKIPYRCLPLVVANQYGWEILSTHHVRASWDGTSTYEGLCVESLGGDGPLHCYSHFGEGVLTFQIPFLFKTPRGWNLMVRGPTNSPKDGIVALDGIIETDWAHSTFTMNWRFTRACTVEFAVREPICLFFPIRRGVLEMFRGEFRMLEADLEFESKFRKWSASRNQFVSGLKKGEPEVVAQGWQKDYLKAAKQRKPLAHPFANENAVDQARTGKCGP